MFLYLSLAFLFDFFKTFQTQQVWDIFGGVLVWKFRCCRRKEMSAECRSSGAPIKNELASRSEAPILEGLQQNRCSESERVKGLQKYCGGGNDAETPRVVKMCDCNLLSFFFNVLKSGCQSICVAEFDSYQIKVLNSSFCVHYITRSYAFVVC